MTAQLARFYFSIECDTCNEDVLYGPVGTTLEHHGLPVIPCDTTSQIKFACENCGGKTYTGDFHDNCENKPGEEPEDDEDDEDAEVTA